MRITNLLLRPTIVEFVDVAAQGLELEIDEIVVTEASPFAGKELHQSKLREEAGVIVVAIKRADGTTVYSPEARALLQPGDRLVTIGRRGAVASSRLIGDE